MNYFLMDVRQSLQRKRLNESRLNLVEMEGIDGKNTFFFSTRTEPRSKTIQLQNSIQLCLYLNKISCQFVRTNFCYIKTAPILGITWQSFEPAPIPAVKWPGNICRCKINQSLHSKSLVLFGNWCVTSCYRILNLNTIDIRLTMIFSENDRCGSSGNIFIHESLYNVAFFTF